MKDSPLYIVHFVLRSPEDLQDHIANFQNTFIVLYVLHACVCGLPALVHTCMYICTYTMEQLVSNWRDVGYIKKGSNYNLNSTGLCLLCRRQPVHMLQYIKPKSTCVLKQ